MPCHLCGVGGTAGWGGDMTCGGCGSPRPAGKEQKKSYRAQKRILLSSSPGMYYNNFVPCHLCGVGWDSWWGGDMTCGGCGSPRPAGKEQKKSYRAQTRILISSSPGMYYNNLCLVTFVGWGGDSRWGRGYDVRWVWFTTPCW